MRTTTQELINGNSFVIQTDQTTITKPKGIIIDVFSFQHNQIELYQKIKEVCGGNFELNALNNCEAKSCFRITPKEHCLVNGGMMYTTIGYIVSALTSSGILLKSLEAIEDMED